MTPQLWLRQMSHLLPPQLRARSLTRPYLTLSLMCLLTMLAAALSFVSPQAARAEVLSAPIAVAGAGAMAFTPDGRSVLVAAPMGSQITRVDTATDLVTATISADLHGPAGIAVDPSGRYAYAGDTWGYGKVSKIDLRTNTEIKWITTDSSPFDLEFNPVTGLLYIANDGSFSMSVLDPSDDSVTSILLNCGQQNSLAITSDGAYAYVLCSAGSSRVLKKVDLATREVVSTIDMPGSRFALSPDNTEILVTSFTPDTVTRFNLQKNEVVATIKVGDGPLGVAYDPTGRFAYVANQTSSTLSKISMSTSTVVGTFPASEAVQGVAFSPDGTYAYVSSNSGFITRVSPIPTPQSITVETPLGQLYSGSSVSLSGSATSGLPVTYTSVTPMICVAAGSAIALLSPGRCVINADQSGETDTWQPAAQTSVAFDVLRTPPAGRVGISILHGAEYTSDPHVTLSLVWPRGATTVTLSNDGGFDAGTTQTFAVTDSINWTLDHSVAGAFTKIAYARFDGPGIDINKTFFDDIILDTNPPIVDTVTMTALDNATALGITVRRAVPVRRRAYRVAVAVSDRLSGIRSVEFSTHRTGVKRLALPFKKSFTLKLKRPTVWFRVFDNAGNATKWKRVSAK